LVTVTNDKLMFGSGGALDYSIYQPAHRRTDVLVVVGHGFLRNKERVAGLARHIASWGLEVTTLDFRHSRPWG
jgi:dienelactone hydrolase